MLTTEEKIKAILEEQLQADQSDMTPNTDLQADFGADSLDQVEVVMQLEEAFDIQITEEEGDKIRTVGDITKLVEKKLSLRTV